MKKGLSLLVLLVIVASLVLTACFPHRPGRHVPRPRHAPALPDLTLLQGAPLEVSVL